MNGKLGLFVKAAVSLGLILWIFSRTDLGEVGYMLASANVWYLLLALALYLGAIAASAVKWQILLRAQGAQVGG